MSKTGIALGAALVVAIAAKDAKAQESLCPPLEFIDTECSLPDFDGNSEPLAVFNACEITASSTTIGVIGPDSSTVIQALDVDIIIGEAIADINGIREMYNGISSELGQLTGPARETAVQDIRALHDAAGAIKDMTCPVLTQ